ncbi:alpha/beta hydrolase family protein [Variovorax terrae]|uniref:Dienelactone hydrolase family protein n=1 Tax=Variovorax terrae TaxID=2923278 RepID=A0A9X1VV65_9BURK|nr:dienelactone hydrolase family protein [Variovorax terrae]MCJ0762452.1 dienelactone hydrolase family protein [Variovorax terrae]
MTHFKRSTLLALALALCSTLAAASVGLTQLPATGDDGPITLFYPSDSAAAPVKRGAVTLDVAWQGQPVRGNGRLVVMSHGSGGAAWERSDLARDLVEAGFVVALPEHQGDNWHDMSQAGPDSWKRRPTEVSHAIDAVLRDARFAPLVAADRVGVYGMSAGGHTALTLAGGRWSPSLLLKHCEAHLAEDFQSCVGLTTQLRGNVFDGLKKAIALFVLRRKLDDTAWYSHDDPRIRALAAEVPFAADFDMASLAAPRVPLGLLRAGQDAWLVPRFHIDAVMAACASCEIVADLPSAGHGSLLSPPPMGLGGLAATLLGDPPGFDRAQVPMAHRQIVQFFSRHLLP